MIDENLGKKRVLHALVLQLALVCMLFGGPVASVYAHPAPFSYLDLHLGRNRTEGTLVVPVANLAHELNEQPAQKLLDPSQIESRREAILKLLRASLQFVADGRQLDLEM